MIRHIVILYLQKNSRIDYLAILEKTTPLVMQIPGILKYEIYRNKSQYVPNDVESFGIEMTFMNQDALDIFMEHPKHFEANQLFEMYLANPPYMVLTHEID
jgi:hypothetical protein